MVQAFLYFGIVMYSVAIGLTAYLLALLIRRRIFVPFTWYLGFITARSALMFTLLSQGNGGWYAIAYRIGHIIETPILTWVLLEIWARQERPADKPIVKGIIIMTVPSVILFSTALLVNTTLPMWSRDFTTYGYMVAWVIWYRGLLRADQIPS